MASEQDELLKQLKEIVESLKNVSQYSKDLTSAVSAANRPMQQMSDYSKAVSEQMKTVGKSMEDMKKAMEGMSTDMGDILNKTGAMGQAETESARNLNEKLAASAQMKKDLTEMQMAHLAIKIKQDEFWTQETTKGKERNDAMEKMGSLWDQVKKKAQDYQIELSKTSQLKQTMGATGAQALTGQSNLSGAIGSISSSISNLLPAAGGIGGLIGMILYGKMREAEFNAIGETVGQQFDAIGGHTNKFAARMGVLSKDLSAYGMVAKEDFAKVAQSMAELGMTQADAETKIKGFRNQAGNDFMAFSISMDKAFEMAAGTTARLAGTLKRDFGQSAREAAENLQLMASSAKETGANVATFMQQVMDASSALRLMHANQSAIIALQTTAGKSFQKTLGPGHEAEANAYAAAGTQQLAQGLAGMDKGLMAVLAEKMGLGHGNRGEALGEFRSMVARGGKELDVTKLMEEMAKMLEKAGPKWKQQEMAGAFGLSVPALDALMAGVHDLRNNKGVDSKTMDTIKNALGLEANKQSVMERLVNEIRNAVADVMVGLLGMVISGLKLIYNGIMAVGTGILGYLTGNEKMKGDSEKYMANVSLAAGGMKAGANQMAKGIDQLPGIAKTALSAFGISGGWGIDDKPIQTVDQKLAAEKAQLAKDSAHNKANTAAMLKAYSAVMHDKNLTTAQKEAWHEAHPVGSDFLHETSGGGGGPTKRAPEVKVTYTEGREQKGKGSHSPQKGK